MLGQPDVYPDLSATVPQIFGGRAVAALTADPDVMHKTGETLRVNDLAAEYGFADTDAEFGAPLATALRAARATHLNPRRARAS